MNINHCIHDSLVMMTIPEIIAVITGVASVWFAKKESILVYPVGIISVLLYVYICFTVKLYADATVNFYYFIMSVYGWYFWKHGGRLQDQENYHAEKEIDSVYIDKHELRNKEEAEIGVNSPAANMYYFIATAILGGTIGYLLDAFTDSNVPYWDGVTFALFCVAMVLMARKKIENWIWWLVGDAVCIPLFLNKGLCFTSLQYVIFTVLAIAGYLSWLHKFQKKMSAG